MTPTLRGLAFGSRGGLTPRPPHSGWLPPRVTCGCGALGTRELSPRWDRIASFGGRALGASHAGAGGGLPARRSGRRAACSPVCRSFGPGAVDRVGAAVPYLLPLLDGFRFGRYFFGQFPFMAQVLKPIFPLYELYVSLPFGSILLFFGLYLGVIQNVQINRFVRFNAMQAILIDILLIAPMLLEMLRPPLAIVIGLYNTVWIYLLCCVIYGMGSCLAGEQPRLPLVADAADQQVR